MAALLANVNMFTLLFHSHPTLSTVPIVGSNGAFSQSEWFGSYYEGSTTPHDGFAWYSSMVNGVGDWLIPLLEQQGDVHGHSLGQIMMHVFVYVFFMTAGSTVFAKFWIETTNMGAKDVAKQIERTGMQIPGFRKNPVVLERILERYIPPVTLFSGAFGGLLAVHRRCLAAEPLAPESGRRRPSRHPRADHRRGCCPGCARPGPPGCRPP